ncbi:MAG: glycosyltransferase [Verrucomicrobiota bacterium]
MRVLHCPTAVGGHPQALAKMERAAGLDSRSVVFGDPAFGYVADEVVRRGGWRFLVAEWRRWSLLREACRDYDVVHFNFGSSLTPHPDRLLFQKRSALLRGLKRVYNLYAARVELRDLPVLRRAGRVIAVTWQGDDARQWDYCREHFRFTHATEVEPEYRRREQDEGIRKRIAVWDRYADIIYALNPDLMHVLPARTRFFPYAQPDIREWSFVGVETGTDRPLRIVHAPSNALVKGTRYIEAALEVLRGEGFSFSYTRVEGMPQREARKIYESADLLIDQLLCGWYGGLSAELMALGKPVVCYLRDEDLGYLPGGMAGDVPVIRADPESVTDVLREVLGRSREWLAERGRRGRAYVERWHAPELIVGTVKADYEAALAKRRAERAAGGGR